MVLMTMKSPWKDLLINASHVLRQSILVEISGRSTGNYYSTIIADVSETITIDAPSKSSPHNAQNEPRTTPRQLILVEI